MVMFSNIDAPLKALIRKINVMRPQQKDALTPFWQMQNEKDVWDLCSSKPLKSKHTKSSDTRPSYIQAKNSDLSGGLVENIYLALVTDKLFLLDVFFAILDKYFPKHQHIDLLDLLGIPNGNLENIHKFVDLELDALKAYEHRCSVCQFSNEIYHSTNCVEVSHIQWSSNGGPDSLDNLVVLCSLHKNLFDVGAFTLSEDYLINVSKHYKPPKKQGDSGLLADFDGVDANIPNDLDKKPGKEYLLWHHENVFI